MSLKEKAKNEAKKRIKKRIRRFIFLLIKPFLPFIIVGVLLLLAICNFADSMFTQETQGSENLTISDDSSSIIPVGMFCWPIPGYETISSHFGMRVHPITHEYKLHAGTDVAAPIGANFVAMASGTVIEAYYSPSYGNMVMIDHR